METKPDTGKVLPANAFRELEPGAVYTPVVPPGDPRPEISIRSVTLGVIMVVIFTFAAAYIGLKTGNVIETSIPIAILAVFIGTLFSRRSSLLENVIVQSIGQAAGVVFAGAIFTIPALYILDLKPSFVQIFLSCLVGGYLGVVLLIPLRRYFVKDLHRQLPIPEGTAIANVLATGKKPAEIIADVNRQFTADVGSSGAFMTLFYLAIDSTRKAVRWVRAGHDPAIVYDPGSQSFEELSGRGIPLGVDEDALFEENEKRNLKPGGVIFIGTDGIWETAGPDGRLFGKEALRELIHSICDRSARDITKAVVQTLEAFRQGLKPADDITMVVIKIL